jgi:hypothetical protein
VTALIFLAALFTPFGVPALVTHLTVNGLRRRREHVSARNQIGRL